MGFRPLGSLKRANGLSGSGPLWQSRMHEEGAKQHSDQSTPNAIDEEILDQPPPNHLCPCVGGNEEEAETSEKHDATEDPKSPRVSRGRSRQKQNEPDDDPHPRGDIEAIPRLPDGDRHQPIWEEQDHQAREDEEDAEAHHEFGHDTPIAGFRSLTSIGPAKSSHASQPNSHSLRTTQNDRSLPQQMRI